MSDNFVTCQRHRNYPFSFGVESSSSDSTARRKSQSFAGNRSTEEPRFWEIMLRGVAVAPHPVALAVGLRPSISLRLGGESVFCGAALGRISMPCGSGFAAPGEAVMGQMRHFLARSPDVWSFARRPSTAALGQSQTARMATAPLRWMCQTAQNGLASRFRSPHNELAARLMRTSEPPH